MSWHFHYSKNGYVFLKNAYSNLLPHFPYKDRVGIVFWLLVISRVLYVLHGVKYAYTAQRINKGSAVRVIHFSDAINQLNQVIDQVVSDSDVAIISRRDAEDTVVTSLNTYNSMMETFYLFKSPTNVNHLEKSLMQYRKGQVKSKALLDRK